MKFKTKYAALCMAAVLGVTAAPAPVLAEGSYSETEKALLADMIQKLAANYTSEMDDFKILENGVHEDLSLRLEDSGKAILGMVAPADLSWFQDITLSSDLSMAEDVAFMDAGLYVNDTKICSLLYYFDLENMDIYMKVPELRDGFIKMNYDQIMAEEQAALENQDAPDLPEDAQQLQQASLQLSSPSVMRASANIRQFLPDTSVIESLLNRYTTPVFDYTEDTASREETLTVYDVSQDCTFYEGQITGEKAAELAEELLNTAKTDKELEDLLNAWDEQLPDTDNLYQSFLDGVEQGLASLAEESPETDAALTSQIWLNAEGEVTYTARCLPKALPKALLC